MTRLKIVTYNIHKGFSAGNRRFVLHEIRQALRDIDADILFLQEIQGEHLRHALRHAGWPDGCQSEFIADDIWHHRAYGKNAIYDKGHHGNAILSKFDFIHWDNIDVSLMKTASRSLLHGSLSLPDGHCLHVICVHLGLLQYERDRQLHRLIQRIESHIPHQEPLIIAGDFNDWRGRAERYFSRALGVEEVHLSRFGRYARTFPAWLPVLPMDRVYSRGLQVVDARPLKGRPWQYLSDHLPLLSEFQLP